MSTTSEPSQTSTTARVTLALSGLSLDGGGSRALECALVHQAGVRYAYVCTATEMAYVVYDPRQVRPDQLVDAVEQAGFHAEAPEPR
jgi:cation transport ATPase